MGKRVLLCTSCNNKMFLWGKTKTGKKRWFCKFCKTSRIYHFKKKKLDIISLFKQYILWGLTYEMLASSSGYSIQYLIVEFHKLLLLDPPKLPRFDQTKSGKVDSAYMLIDGLWFGRWFVLMLYRQSGTLYLLHISIAGREASTKITKDLRYIKDNLKYIFTGFVTDGGTAICSAVDEVYPHAPHQICLAHMHRQIVSALGRYSKDKRITDLISLSNQIWFIESHNSLKIWETNLKDWVRTNFFFLKETRKDDTGRTWYIHKGVRKAVRILIKLPKSSFKFLDHPTMPKTTNEIEATFGHIGQRWLRHKGLKKTRWESYLKWFVYYYNLKVMADNKTREDRKNNTVI